MTNQEAIKQISDAIKAYNNLYPDKEIEYIKALRVAITALEKQEPIKPQLNYESPKALRKLLGEENTYTCAYCGNVCLKRCSATRNETFYCWNCGQALDWTEEDAE